MGSLSVSAEDHHPRVGFEVPTAVVMISVIWNVTLVRPLQGSGRFGGTNQVHFQG
jgi:hypothetical protein